MVHYKHLWNLEIPLKIRIILWLLHRNSILTKSNLIKRGQIGNVQCHFYYDKEVVDHLLFRCLLATLVWQVVDHALELGRTPSIISDLFLDFLLSTFPKNQIGLMLCVCSALLDD